MPSYDEICQDPQLADLPFRMETDRLGKIIMRPHIPRQSLYQTAIRNQILELSSGTGVVLCACPIETEDGTKVPDLVWISAEQAAELDFDHALKVAPQVCVEVKSRFHSLEEVRERFRLLFSSGAQECWLCDKGSMSFFAPGLQSLETSRILPTFPAWIDSLAP